MKNTLTKDDIATLLDLIDQQIDAVSQDSLRDQDDAGNEVDSLLVLIDKLQELDVSK